MRKLRKVLSVVMAFILLVTGIQVSGLTVDAETEWTETAITSLKYEVTVENSVSGGDALESFDWTTVDGNWSEKKTTVALNGDGDYTIEVANVSASGLINLGYITQIADSAMTVTINKVVVNGYELVYEAAPVLKANSSWENGLVNIWSGLESGAQICGSDNAYLAFDGDASLIKLYVGAGTENETEWTETTITSLKYEVAVENSVSGGDALESFDWTTVDGNWSEKKTTVALNGDGDYTIEVANVSASGLINLGYITQIADSAMTVTINKVVVNGYELVYEAAPVLKANSSWENGLVNIWSGLESGAQICGSDNAYLAFDGDASLIKFYTKQTSGSDDDIVIEDSASLDYVKAMGDGWNLGNSFDGVNTSLDEEDLGEEAWGNPVVVKELIQAAADKGYDSIRIPITFYRRFDEETYVIDEDWLARVKEVVQWAVDEDLYVMINVHHDSWLWLEYWDGNTESEEYVKFTKIWEQFADYFKDMSDKVCFETINEPVFEATGDITAQDKLDMVNQAAYDAIRNSGGNNATRMIVIPTYTTNHGDEHCEATVAFIEAQDDENLIATVHYYSEWVHSAGIGKTGFDEVLWQNNGEDYTPRDSVDLFYETLQKQFLNKGIGVIVGEWGLLGYDSASQVNQAGEELKYYEYMNHYANQTEVCLMFWDNGSGIDRTSGDYNWKKPLVGEMLETSMSERSAYVTDLDRVFLTEETEEDLSFPLTLNGLEFVGIGGLTEGTDYTYDEASATVTLSKDYVNTELAAIGDEYGTFAELVFQFSGGADWHEYLIRYAEPVTSETTGTTSDIKIPVDFKGSEVRRATAYMASGKVGPNSSWWDYLQYGSAFLPDYETGTIAILSGFWGDPTVVDGAITFHFEMYDGSFMKYTLEKDGENVIGYPALDASEVTLEVADEICVYVGETKIKDTYFNIPKGTGVYGTYTEPENATDYITLTGWPATMTFGTKAQKDSIKIGLLLTYQDREEYPGNITFWLKDAPVVEAVTVDEGSAVATVVKNLAETAVVTYEVADTTVATVAADGTIRGVEEGTTKVTATVTQYGRTDSFEATVTVNHVCAYDDAWKSDADNHWHECECGEKSGVAAHTVASWTITKAPTKETVGEMTGTCSVCAKIVTKEMPVTGTSGDINVPERPDNACKGEIADKDGIIGKIELTDAEKIAIENGADLNIILKVMDILNTISQTVKDEFAKVLNGATVGTYLDISLFKQIGNNPEMGITETNGKVKISLEIPEALKNTDANIIRTYSVWHYHNGVVKALDCVYDGAAQKVTFETDGFSTFVIAYSDVNNGAGNGGNNNGGNSDGGNTNTGNNSGITTTSNAALDTVPKTGDTNELFFWFALMVVAGIGAAIYGFKNRKETSEE